MEDDLFDITPDYVVFGDPDLFNITPDYALARGEPEEVDVEDMLEEDFEEYFEDYC